MSDTVVVCRTASIGRAEKDFGDLVAAKRQRPNWQAVRRRIRRERRIARTLGLAAR